MPSTPLTTTSMVNGAFEITTQANILRETASASGTVDGNYLTSTVWPNSITAQAMAVKPITQHHDQIIFHFGWIDYGLFVALLGISTLIGIFYGFFSKHKQNNIAEYIFGGRTMKILPVATSMIASHISGQTFVGIPTEVYTHGTQYVVFVLAAILSSSALAYVSLPLFHRIGVTSTFEYLERRFDRRIRLLGSFIYSIKYISFIPVVIYVPALAFSQASGLDLHFVAPIICSICIFYTTFGGLRAVVWTDFIQLILMTIAIVIVVVLGAYKVGGFANVWAAAERGGRLIIFNMDTSPFVRTSFWTMFLGLTVSWMAGVGFSQSTVQRFLSLPDLNAGQKSVLYFTLGFCVIKFFAVFLGLCAYAMYEHCDPISVGDITRSDQIVPLFVIQVGQKLPGIGGLFIAGIFAASLATMSGQLNTLSGTIYMDFVRPCLSKQTEKQASNKVKAITVAVGILVTSLVFVVEQLGSIFQLTTQLSGLVSGSLLTMFTLGMTSRSANTKGLITGVTMSCMLLTIMFIGAQLNHIAKDPTLPLQTDECPNNDDIISKHRLDQQHLANSTVPSVPSAANGSHNGIFWLFRLCFMLYPVAGFAISMAIGQMVSWLTGGRKQKIDENLLMPFFQSAKFKQQRTRHQDNSTRYTTIDQMLVEMMKMEKRTVNEIEHNSDHDDADDDDEAFVTVADVKSPSIN